MSDTIEERRIFMSDEGFFVDCHKPDPENPGMYAEMLSCEVEDLVTTLDKEVRALRQRLIDVEQRVDGEWIAWVKEANEGSTAIWPAHAHGRATVHEPTVEDPADGE